MKYDKNLKTIILIYYIPPRSLKNIFDLPKITPRGGSKFVRVKTFFQACFPPRYPVNFDRSLIHISMQFF